MRKFSLCLVAIFAVTISKSSFANYAEASTFFQKKDYVRAAGSFFQSYSYPKSAAEKMKAEWGLAESLRLSNMFYSASKYYSLIIRRGPKENNPFFRQALEQLGVVDATVSVGQSQIVTLFKHNLEASMVPNAAKGFYFYYLGIESFLAQQFEKASGYFSRVPGGNDYYTGAQFYLGVVNNLAGRHSRAVGYFESVMGARQGVSDELREMAIMNIARIHYETGKYRQSIQFYAKIPRGSENWLDSLWESSWAFFIMQKHNEALGNIHTIHSPFYYYYFYPESYILQSITFLRLCRYEQVKESLLRFRSRYKNVFGEVKGLLDKSSDDPIQFFKTVANYRSGSLTTYKEAWPILNKLSRTDSYKEAAITLRNSDREKALLARYDSYWKGSGLSAELADFLDKKKAVAIKDAGSRLYAQGTDYYAFLRELSDQTGLIQAEMLEGKIDSLRKKINVKGNTIDRVEFSGGMQELSVEQRYEYWPFQGEYWEDELGYYVYNIDSQCKGKE